MSWSVNFKIDEMQSDINDVISEETESGLDTAEHREQFEVAKEAIAIIIASGAVGNMGKKYRVVVGGHGNPDHEPAYGWANDFISINIYQEAE